MNMNSASNVDSAASNVWLAFTIVIAAGLAWMVYQYEPDRAWRRADSPPDMSCWEQGHGRTRVVVCQDGDDAPSP